MADPSLQSTAPGRWRLLCFVVGMLLHDIRWAWRDPLCRLLGHVWEQRVGNTAVQECRRCRRSRYYVISHSGGRWMEGA